MAQIPDSIAAKIAKGREFRNMAAPLTRSEGKDGIVEGYATTFNQPYVLWREGGYMVMEQIDREAFKGCDMSDFIMQYDHQGRVFARTRNNTLSAEPDEHGLHVVADLSGTELGRQVYDEVRGGYSDRMSFAFTVKEDTRTVTEDHETGEITVLRTITEIDKLYDVSIVSIPANDATEIFARGMAAGESCWARQELASIEERRRQEAKFHYLMKLIGG